MCELCGHYPHLQGCPNEEHECDICGEPLKEGETAYDIYGDVMCEKCARSWLEGRCIAC